MSLFCLEQHWVRYNADSKRYTITQCGWFDVLRCKEADRDFELPDGSTAALEAMRKEREKQHLRVPTDLYIPVQLTFSAGQPWKAIAVRRRGSNA